MNAGDEGVHGDGDGGDGGPSKSILVPVTLCLVFVAFVFVMHALPYFMTSGKRRRGVLSARKKAGVELKVQ